MPPGPPVLATLLAEVYGPDSTTRRAVVRRTQKDFASVPYIVDIDDPSVSRARACASRSTRTVLNSSASNNATSTTQSADLLRRNLGRLFSPGRRTPSHRDRRKATQTRACPGTKRWPQRRCLPTSPGNRTVVELGDVVRVTKESGSPIIFRRDGHFAEWSWQNWPAPMKPRSTECWT